MKLILSISGGGIRGIIPAIILEHIEKQMSTPIVNYFDLISGTSTGGLVAAMLAVPGKNNRPKYTAKEVVDIYKRLGRQVFCRPSFRKFATLNGLIYTKYSCKPLESLLKQYLGNTTLSQAVTNLLLPAYQISNNPYPYFFKTFHAKRSTDKLKNPYLWECARATSAANGYFKPYKIGKDLTFLDGGIFANNPAMCAYAQAKSLYGEKEQIVLVSIGTGENLIGYDYKKIRHWGMLQWALPFFKQTSISADETVNYMLKKFTANGDKHFCFQTLLDKKSLRIDDASNQNIKRLESSAQDAIIKNQDKFSNLIKILSSKKIH